MKSFQLPFALCLWFSMSFFHSWAQSISAWPHNEVVVIDAKKIEHVMKSMFDKPEAPLLVTPITVHGRYAVAGWIQGDHGGRAFLKKENNQWSIRLCGGEGLKQADALVMAGMRRNEALQLAAKIAVDEQRVSSEDLKKLSLFQGIIEVSNEKNDVHQVHPRHH